MNCSDTCEHLVGFHSIHSRAQDFTLDLVRAVLCYTCTSAMRDYHPTRTESLALWRELREVILPPPDLDDEGMLVSRGCKMSWVKSAAKPMLCPHCKKEIEIAEKIGSLYPQVVFDAEGNVTNVVIHVGRAGRGMSAAKTATGLFIQELLEWGCPIERIVGKLKGHAAGVGGTWWPHGKRMIHSFEDAVGAGIEYLLQHEEKTDKEAA